MARRSVEPSWPHRGSSAKNYAVGDSSVWIVRLSTGQFQDAHATQRLVRIPRMFTISARPSSVQATRMRHAGGAEGIRTPDLRLAKAALSQLSYGPARRGWASLESNQGPQSYQDCALAD